jgi:hypothetical protein
MPSVVVHFQASLSHEKFDYFDKLPCALCLSNHAHQGYAHALTMLGTHNSQAAPAKRGRATKAIPSATEAVAEPEPAPKSRSARGKQEDITMEEAAEEPKGKGKKIAAKVHVLVGFIRPLLRELSGSSAVHVGMYVGTWSCLFLGILGPGPNSHDCDHLGRPACNKLKFTALFAPSP